MTTPAAGARSQGPGDRLAAALERIAVARRALAQQAATRLGLSVLQVEIVRHLTLTDAVRATDLAVELGVRLPTVSDGLSALRGKGLVEDRPGRDARSKTLLLTRAGRDVAAEVDEVLAPFTRAAAAAGPEGVAAAFAVIGGLWREGVLSVDRSCATCRHHVEGAGPAGRCDLLDLELTPLTLRSDCPDHGAA